MNKYIRVFAIMLGLGAFVLLVWFSFDLMSAKSNFWWLGGVAIMLGLWGLILYINWILKPKNNKHA